MRIKKMLSIAAACLIFISAVPISVSATENETADKLEYALNIDGTAVITNVRTDKEMFTIPELVEGVQVVGVADYAFAFCENLEVINVPDSLTNSYTFNVAFLTSSAFMNFMDNELSESATIDDIIKYIAVKSNYKNGNFTESDLADASVKFEKKLKTIDISAADTLEAKIMTLIKNVQNLDISDDLKDRFYVWVSTVTYNGLTLRGSEDTEMQKYALSRKHLDLNYEVIPDYVLGDANGDGKFNIRDAAFVAARMARGESLNIRENPGADYNQDEKINIRDAARMASDLAKGTVQKK